MSTQGSTKIPSPIHSQGVRKRVYVPLTLAKSASDNESPKRIQASPRRDVTSITSDVHIAAIANSANSYLAHESSSPQITGESAKPNPVVNTHTDEELLFQSYPVSPNRYKSSPSGNSQSPFSGPNTIKPEYAKAHFEEEQMTSFSEMLSTVSLLKSENKSLQHKLETVTERTLKLERDVSEGEETIKNLRLSHHEELCCVKKEMGTELLDEKEKLLNQIRELTTLKCAAETEASSLKELLFESEVKAKELKATSDNAHTSGSLYKDEVKTLKEEVLTLRTINEESEKSRESLMKAKKEVETKLDQLSVEQKLLLENVDDERAYYNDQEASLKERLRVAESRNTQLEEEKATIALEVEKKVIAETAKLVLNHRDTVHDLKKEIEDAEATIRIQEQRIVKLQQDMHSGAKTGRKSTQGLRKEPKQGRDIQSRIPVRTDAHKTPLGKDKKKESSGKSADISCRSPSPISSDSMLCSSVSYYGGRWTANRADFRKHAEEMVLITEALEEEGYGPTQATVDEVIRHLWWKKEHVQKELQSTKETLSKAIGEDQYKQLQEWKERVEKMEQELRETKEKHERSESQVQASRQLLEEKLTSLLQNHHQGAERNQSLRQKQQVLSKENEELRTKLKDLRGKLMDKATTVAQLEAESASYKSEASATQHELSLQQQRGQVLQTKVESISTELATQKQELMELSMSNGSTMEKLTQAEENARLYRKETASLKAKVGELEGELGIRSQKIDHLKTERDSLWNQLESLNSQLVTVESQLSREKTNSSNFQSLMEELEGALSRKDDELQLAISQQSDLSVQFMTTRNELQVVQEKKAGLDAEVHSRKAEILCCKEDLAKATSNCAKLEAELESKLGELSHSHEMSKSLQTSVTNLQQDIDVAYKGLEVEKAANRQLKSAVDLLNGNVKRLNQRLEGVDSENTQLKKDLTQKKQELLGSHEETRSLRMELKEAQTKYSHLQREFESVQKECRAQAKELAQTKDTLFTQRQKLTVANQDLIASKHELGDVNTQLLATHSENVQLMKASKVHESEIQELKAKLSAAVKQSSDKQHLLQEKEDEIKVLRKDKSALTSELSQLTSSHNSVVAAKTKVDDEVKSLSSELERTKQQLIEAQQFLDTKIEELDGAQTQVEKLESALSCETEKCATLSMEFTSREADLHLSRDHNAKLEADLFQLKGKHLEKTETADHTIMNLQQQVQLVNHQLASLQSQHTVTMGLKEKAGSELKLVTEERNEVKAKLSLVAADLASTKEVKAALERKVSLVERELNTVKLDSDDKMAAQGAEVSEMKAALVVSQSQLKHTSEELQMFRNHLEEERSKVIATSKQLEASEDVIASLKEQLDHVEGEMKDEQVRVESLTTHLMDSQSKSEELSQQLYSVKQETYAQQELLQESEAKFSKCMTSLKQTHEEEKRRVQYVNSSLIEDLSHTRDHVVVIEKQLEACESELIQTTSKMTHLEQKCAHLEAELHSQTNVQETIEDHCSQLKSEHTDARIQIGELNERICEQTETVEQIKVELHSSTLECDSLRGQLQLQRETAASSLSRIQRHHEEKCKSLHAKIQELNNKLKEANSSVRALQRDVTILRADNVDLTECFKQEKEKCSLLKENLQEETTQAQVCLQKAEQLEISVQMERSAKTHLQECLAEERTLRMEFEATAADLKKQFTSTSNELSQCRTSLTKVKTQNEQLKGDLQLVQAELYSAKHQLGAIRDTLKSVRMQAEKDTTSLKQKYHGEKKTLKEKVKDLKEQVQSLTVRNDSQREEVSRLSATNHSLNDDQRKSTRKLTETEHMLQSKKDECKELQIKNNTLDMQVSQLQQEVSTLCKVQYEFEEQRKRNEARSRNQMQHILSDVTEHMEQQHTAHRYLEKLRTENETIALKERDRMVGQLKNELKMKKQECKKDQLHIEQLELESKYHKSQQRDQEASRRKLEARLEQVNNTLSHTLPLSNTSYRSTTPLYSSTPTSSRYQSASRTHSNY